MKLSPVPRTFRSKQTLLKSGSFISAGFSGIYRPQLHVPLRLLNVVLSKSCPISKTHHTLEIMSHPAGFQSTFPNWVLFPGIVLGYLGLGELCNLLIPQGSSVSLIGFSAGFAFAVVLLSRGGLWPAVLLGAILSGWLTGKPWSVNLCDAVGITGSTLFGYWALKRSQFDTTLSSLSAIFPLIFFTVLVLPVGTATAEIVGRSLAAPAEWVNPVSGWWLFWTRDSLGLLLITPLTLVLRRDWVRGEETFAWKSCLLWLTAFGGLAYLVFLTPKLARFPLAFVFFPLLLWSGTRFGTLCTLLGCLILGLVGAIGVRFLKGPFADLQGIELSLTWALFLGVHVLTGLLLSVAVGEQRRTDLQLHTSQEFFRAISEQMPDGLMVVEAADQVLESRVVQANWAAGRMRGYQPGEMVGMPLAELIAPELLEQLPSRWEHLLEGKTLRLESSHQRKDGTAFPVDISSRRIVLGSQHYIVILIRDVSKRKEAEQALRDREARLALAQELAELGWWEWYPATNLLILSLRMKQILGFAEEEETDTPEKVFSRVHPEDLPRLQEVQRLVTEKQISKEVEYRAVIPGKGERVVYSPPGLIELNEDGEIHRVLGTAWDITVRKQQEAERVRLEARIQHGQKLESLAVLAGGVAHDFNNLLTVIMGNANLAEMELAEESPARLCLAQLVEASERAADLCNQMLAYSGKGHFLIETVNFNRMIPEIAPLLESVISSRAEVEYQLNDPLPMVEVDTTQMRQVLLNLLTNASEALAEEGGRITVSTASATLSRADLNKSIAGEELEPGTFVILEVADTGSGMTKATCEKIFDPFFSTRFTGRGLGLAAVLGIVRGHEGALRVDSQPGRGTRFQVLLPATGTEEPVAEVEVESTNETIDAGTGTILVVEDEPMVLKIAREALERAGYQVLTSNNGEGGIEVLRQHHPQIDLVVLDLTMPTLSGVETFEQMRQIQPEVRVLLTTGYNEEEVNRRFGEHQPTGFLQKPFRPQELVDVIRRIMSVARM